MIVRFLLIGLLVAGCATTGGSGSYPGQGESPKAWMPVPACLPTGLPPFVQWTAGPVVRRMMIPDAPGPPSVMVMRLYRVAEHVAMTGWLGSLLALVDTDTYDAAAPVWYDPGVVTYRGPAGPTDRDFDLAAAPRQQSCQWKQAEPGQSRTQSREGWERI